MRPITLPGVAVMKWTRSDCLYHLTPSRNLAGIAAEGLVPQVGVRSWHAGMTKQFVHCFTSLDAVETALNTWVPEAFSADEPIALLAVDVRPNVRVSDDCVIAAALPPHLVWIISDNAVAEHRHFRRKEPASIEEYLCGTTAPGPTAF